MTAPAKAILIAKDDVWGEKAARIVQAHFPGRSEAFHGGFGSPYPLKDRDLNGELLLSFLCPWVVPERHLKQVWAAINFHPGSSRYPGIGCYNFALYDGAQTYGPVAHFMAPKVDKGAIIDERLFPIQNDETVASLRTRTIETMLAMLADLMPGLCAGERPAQNGISWQREPYTRRELNVLCEITMDMDDDEIARRIRATDYPGYPGARQMIKKTDRKPSSRINR